MQFLASFDDDLFGVQSEDPSTEGDPTPQTIEFESTDAFWFLSSEKYPQHAAVFDVTKLRALHFYHEREYESCLREVVKLDGSSRDVIDLHARCLMRWGRGHQKVEELLQAVVRMGKRDNASLLLRKAMCDFLGRMEESKACLDELEKVEEDVTVE